jgi:peptidoglycan hydrolase-like protein with peptidoglycan-binding domain
MGECGRIFRPLFLFLEQGPMNTRRYLTVAAFLLLLNWNAGAANSTKKKAPAKKSASTLAQRRSVSSARKRTTTSTRKRSSGNTRTAARTWRSRQMTPTPERYKQIQDALVAKGYLSGEDANGVWGPSSVEALKRFQAEQNIEATGKINSLSLIALGLGPKRETADASVPAPAER